VIVRIRLGGQLRRLREAAAVSPKDAAWQIRASPSKISRMENGRIGFKERDILDLLALYGVTDGDLIAARCSSPRRPTPIPGGRSTATSSPAGSSRTSAWRPPRSGSGPSTCSSSTAWFRRRTTPAPSSPWV
jgi:hypothetical protein